MSNATPTHTGKPYRGRTARWRWSSRFAFGVIASVNVLTLTAAAMAFSREATSRPEEFRAAAAVVFALSACWQAWILRNVFARKDRLKAFTLGLMSPFWQWLILALAGSYVIALLIGPGIRAQNAFAAMAVLSYSVILHRYTRRPKRNELAARGANSPRFSLRQSLAWGICGLIVATCGAEISLRMVDSWSDKPTQVANFVRSSTLPTGVKFRGRLPNELGFWDDEFEINKASHRVAVLGDELTLTGDADTNFVTRLDQRLSNVDVQHFGVAGTSPREYGVVLAAEAARYRPEVVIAIVNLANDVTEPPELPGVFDWRGLRLYEWGVRRWQPHRLHPKAFGCAAQQTNDYTTLLQVAESDLTVCRTPIAVDVRQRWQTTFRSLQKLKSTCERIGGQLVVVIVPSRAQVDAALSASAQRRLGLTAANIDVSLPQRRMITFAENGGLSLVDLTPLVAQDGSQSYCLNCPEWTATTHDRVAQFLAPVVEARLQTKPAMFAVR